MKNIQLLLKGIMISAIFILVAGCAAKKELVELKEVRQEEQASYAQLKKEVGLLNNEFQTTKQWNVDLRTENTQLVNQIRAAKASLCQISGQESECPADLRQGIVFKVQIGAFKTTELPEDPDNPIIIFDKEDKSDMQKIVLGYFRDYSKANALKSQLKAMGVKDAWIVSYKDGERVPIKTIFPE